VRRTYFVLHHVLKELSSKRLAADQKAFAQVRPGIRRPPTPALVAQREAGSTAKLTSCPCCSWTHLRPCCCLGCNRATTTPPGDGAAV
jgi:hypothetical protein